MRVCKLTNSAKDQINRICQDNSVHAVFLGLKGGGCAGFEYEWGSISDPESIEPTDYVIDTGTGRFVIKEASVSFLKNAEVDFVKSMVGSKFEINNPNAQAACGCGVSLDFKPDSLSYSIDGGGK